ncbi:hypothetical protein OVA24_12610 [Luteolibacter sp. SL250]|uniref:hypothetical protein n=1 Tax=Luteolibacter sp. SL250 TaxID=2995170 RepID=UPI0022700463|nr:hypothetical protein [Luteolibacter sp. SL250]WAC18079.1 hypothetical protein OVA24_12610 [Luteolibacter sp. SL250]
MPPRITAPEPTTILRTLKMLWQSVSMAAFLGSLLTALIFHGDLPENTAFVWTMGVFAGSLLLALPLLLLLSVPFLAGIRAFSRRYDRHLFPTTVIGGMCGVVAVVLLLLFIRISASGLTLPGPLPVTAASVGKILLVGFAYGMSLALFICLNQRPADRHREIQPPR